MAVLIYSIPPSDASAGVSAAQHSWLDFGASHEASQKLVLGAVETYGLGAVDADAALKAYCAAPATRAVCTEDVARKYLQSLLGDQVFDKHFDVNSKEYQYDVTIRLIMVSRVINPA